VASGLLKLLCPDGKCEDYEVTLAVKTAVNARQRVNALLSSVSPQEFSREKQIMFSIV
jgi:predicted ATP-dependent Lon-type protease